MLFDASSRSEFRRIRRSQVLCGEIGEKKKIKKKKRTTHECRALICE